MLEGLFSQARSFGLPRLEIGAMTLRTDPHLVEEVCDEVDARLVLVHPDEMMTPCGFVESGTARIPVSREGDPRKGGRYVFWLGAADECAVEDYFDERERIISSIRARVAADADGTFAAREDLLDAFSLLCRRQIDLSGFDLDAFAAELGTPIGPVDPFDVLTQRETRREARRRQRHVHVSGALDNEYLLEAGRDRAQALAATGGTGAPRYANIARDFDLRLSELVARRLRLLGVTFAIGQRAVDEVAFRKDITVLRIACDDAQQESDRLEPVLDAARRVAAHLPFEGDAPYDIGAFIKRDIDLAYDRTMMNVARLAFGKLVDLAMLCCCDTGKTDRELAAVRTHILLYEEYDRVKAELGTD
jgi:hypothetical protein